MIVFLLSLLIWCVFTSVFLGRGIGAIGEGICHPVSDNRGSAAVSIRSSHQQQKAEETEEDVVSERSEEAARHREWHQRAPRSLWEETHTACLSNHRG